MIRLLVVSEFRKRVGFAFCKWVSKLAFAFFSPLSIHVLGPAFAQIGSLHLFLKGAGRFPVAFCASMPGLCSYRQLAFGML